MGIIFDLTEDLISSRERIVRSFKGLFFMLWSVTVNGKGGDVSDGCVCGGVLNAKPLKASVRIVFFRKVLDAP